MRFRERAVIKELPEGALRPLSVAVRYQSIYDRNNGRRRPNSPANISDTKCFLQTLLAGGGAENSVVNFQANLADAYIHRLFRGDIDRFGNAAVRHLEKKKESVIGSFSSLNFAYELREVDSLLKKIHEFRYIDYAFGIAPMIADLKTALSEVDKRISSFNSKIEKLKTPISIDWGYTTTHNVSGSVDFYPGQAISHQGSFQCKHRIKGSLGFTYPYLASISPEAYNLLDTLAIDASVGNLWEAVPYSWLVDWFLPVGLALDTLPSAMMPIPMFSGTISHRIRGNASIKTEQGRYVTDFFPGQMAGLYYHKSYSRIPVEGSTGGMIEWNFFPDVTAAKMMILRDIMYPVKKKSGRK